MPLTRCVWRQIRVMAISTWRRAMILADFTVAWSLAERIRAAGKLPEHFGFEDEPTMTLRGVCVGMQKTYILPGRKIYEYPYTPELFPWFYDKELWREYLDFLVENRMNTLYLWNGHPFASLVQRAGISLRGRGAGGGVREERGDVPLVDERMRQTRHLAGADVLQPARVEAVCGASRNSKPSSPRPRPRRSITRASPSPSS